MKAEKIAIIGMIIDRSRPSDEPPILERLFPILDTTPVLISPCPRMSIAATVIGAELLKPARASVGLNTCVTIKSPTAERAVISIGRISVKKRTSVINKTAQTIRTST
jgi:hypothetical protein